ncbi:MAG: cytidine deaminase [Alphaproteobacteria bacterium]|jgi:cytidine deaminase|nr:cytidine deaminase [Alphaproteobacteria bacterium]
MDRLDKLFDLVKKAQTYAYAPYSNFNVGAVILSENGNYYSGANIENAAYPQGCCAEQSAIAAMIMNGEKKIKEIAVIGMGDLLCTPCGGCRQKIREFGNSNTQIHIFSQAGFQKTFTLEELLPESFGPDNLSM